jgi:glutamate racemase
MQRIVRVLPCEDVIYVADSAYCPYGNKPPQEILRLSQRIADFLIDKQCGIVVVACNTATAAAISTLRKTYPHTAFVGMEPAIKPAAEQSTSKRIAVLATKGTFKGRLFKQTMQKYTQDTDVEIIVGAGLVELVEQGKENTPEAVAALQKLLQPAISKGIDTLVLGCTHYPFLTDAINAVTGGNVRLIDAAMPVALQTKRLLERGRTNSDTAAEHIPAYFFYTSGNTDILQQMQERHLQLPNVQYVKLPLYTP